MAAQPYTYAFAGGLDLTSAALAVPPGRVIAALNYEPLAEGYGRVEGFERVDGGALPSRTPFSLLDFVGGTSPIQDGHLVTGGVSGATARVCLDPLDFAGSWDAGTAAGRLVLVAVTGTFVAGEPLLVASTARAAAAGPAIAASVDNAGGALVAAEAAMAWRRAAVQKVPGIGPVRGVAVFNGTLYAWRDQDGSHAAMFKATPTGWVQITGSFSVGFVNLGAAPTIGGTLNQPGTGANAIVTGYAVNEGSFDAGTATGVLFLSGVSGAFAQGAATIGFASVELAGAQTAVRFVAGGRYGTLAHNFYGRPNQRRLYGVNGTGRAFEFDGATVVPIATGRPIATDTPTHVAEIANHLVLAYREGSVQLSEPGEPRQWDGALGAVELGFGHEVTNLVGATDSALVVTGTGRIATLQGRDAATFQLDTLTDEAGAEAWTAAKVGTTIYVDRRGLRSLNSTSAFGNFKAGALSELVAPYFRAKFKAGARPVLSYIVKAKSQYRLIWDDGTGLSVYMGRKQAESLPFSTGDVRLFCATTAEMDDGDEAIFAGGEDGYVYRFDSGCSFDGERIRSFAMTPFNHLGSARQEKRYHGAAIEAQAPSNVDLRCQAQFDYGDGSKPDSGADVFMAGAADFVLTGAGGAWDAAIWNSFNWSTAYEGSASTTLDGIGRNVSLVIGAEAGLLEQAHILQAYTVTASPRRRVFP